MKNTIKAHKKTHKKRKDRIENIKLTIGLFIAMIILFGGMFAYWIIFGYAL